MLFTFDNQQEMEKILASEPWSFDKHLVVLQRYEKDVDYAIWILTWQIFGFRYMKYQSDSELKR